LSKRENKKQLKFEKTKKLKSLARLTNLSAYKYSTRHQNSNFSTSHTYMHDHTTITTTKPYPTKWGWLHGSNDTIMLYYYVLDPCHRDSTKFYVGCLTQPFPSIQAWDQLCIARLTTCMSIITIIFNHPSWPHAQVNINQVETTV
jgi:hypothetical protein